MAMLKKVVSVLYLCLLALLVDAHQWEEEETSTLSPEEMEKFIEGLDSEYPLSPEETDSIVRYMVNLKSADRPTYPSHLRFNTEEGTTYSADTPTEWYEASTEPMTEHYVEVFKPSEEVLLPIQDRRPPVNEKYAHDRKTQVDEQYEGHQILYVGSSRGMAGYHFPNYLDIPHTEFNCMEKSYIPGFYADLDTGCQVFHVCWPHRKESFLCPVGTTFNQALLACDYWYNSNCSMAPHYYHVNSYKHETVESGADSNVGSMIDTLIEKGHSEYVSQHKTEETSSEESIQKVIHETESDMSHIMKFLPIKAKVTVYPETDAGKSKIVAEASVGKKVKKPFRKIVVKEVPHKYEHKPVESMHKYEHKPVEPVHKYEPKLIEPMHKYEQKPIEPVHRPSVSDIVDEIFAVAKKIVEESRGMTSDVKFEKPKRYVQKPLTVLNPKFIMKPVPVEASVLDKSMFRLKPKVQSKLDFNPVMAKKLPVIPKKKPVKEDCVKPKVSPLTKKALAESYLRLLKRSGNML